MGTGITSLPDQDGPSYALVIGVSKHDGGLDPEVPDQILKPAQFPNLRVAAKDATDFAEALTTCAGFDPACVTTLCDDRATLEGIRDALEGLRKECRRPGRKPTVVVFFAGHGWADADKRHYLVPFDGRRNALYKTGLRNRELRDLLADLETDRLVVFIDACHAGAVADPDARGRTLPDYDARQEMGSGGKGQFVIASCEPHQNSYEWKEKGNGIFTSHLLELLKGETNEIPEEDITPLGLFTPLANRVSTTAKKLGWEQDPYVVVQGSDRIVLAKNRFIQLRRDALEAKRRECGQALKDRLHRRSSNQRWVVARLVVDHSLRVPPIKDPRYDEFFGMLNDFFDIWANDPDSIAELDHWCNLLLSSYEDLRSPVKDARPQIQQKPPADQFVSARSQAHPGPVAEPPAPARSAPERPQTRLQLSAEDREWIVAKLDENEEYLKQAKFIRDRLLKLVSRDEFTEALTLVRGTRPGDRSLDILLKDAAGRFDERWARIEAEGTAKSGNVILDQKGDV